MIVRDWFEHSLASALAVGLLLFALHTGPAAAETLPPPIGPAEPRVEPLRGDDGIYRQAWFHEGFLDLAEDHAEARAEGKRLAIIFEQRGCIYCTKLHTEVLSRRYINDYARGNFRVIQLDLWGSREVTDFDGTRMPEKKLAERWGVIFTPTIIFFKEDIGPLKGQWGRALEASGRMPLGIGEGTFYDMLVWIKSRTNERDPSFQRFHIARHEEREALKRQTKGSRTQ
jgi:thioredoxin-related protein